MNSLMAMYRFFIIGSVFFLVLVFMVGCGKDDPMPCESAPEPEQWDKFIGDYKVYDSLGVFSHDMVIEHFFSGDNSFGNDADSLIVHNFNGQFNFNFQYRTITIDGVLDIGNIDPLTNFNGSQFYFWHNSDDPETPQVENFLQNDTIYLSYLLDNTPYWLSDGVPYFNCECKEIAVKQN